MRPAHTIAMRDVDYLEALVTRYDPGWHEANDILFGGNDAQGRRAARRLAAYGLVELRHRNMHRPNVLIVRVTQAGRVFIAAMSAAQQQAQHKHAAK